MFVIILILLSLVFLVLLAIVLAYFMMGIKSAWSGKKENSRQKIAGGVTTIFISLAAMVCIFLLWRWLNSLLLSWE